MENKLTPGSNLLWESSRMMLPEHKALLRQHEESRYKKQKPNYDEQLLAHLVNEIEVAFHQNKAVTITYYEQEVYHDLLGKIVAIDYEKRLIRLATKNKTKDLYLADFVSIEIN